MRGKPIRIAVLFLFCMMLLSGCGSHGDVTGKSAEMQQSETRADFYEYDLEEVWCRNGRKNIYGRLYRPRREGEIPLVIYSHGLAENCGGGGLYGDMLASHGAALYCFDFCGGSEESRSDGTTTEMSLETEISDLEAVLDMAKRWDFVDPDRIVLVGFSQGGAVTALTAARREEDTMGIILGAPAFNLPDLVHEYFEELEDVPQSCFFLSLTVGKRYFEDAWDVDLYEEVKNYSKPVLLIHGGKDDIVPPLYSEYALRVYRQAELVRIDEAGHHLIGDAPEQVRSCILDFLYELDFFRETEAE